MIAENQQYKDTLEKDAKRARVWAFFLRHPVLAWRWYRVTRAMSKKLTKEMGEKVSIHLDDVVRCKGDG